MANDVSVRSYLQGKGYSNDDIGYDPNTNYVQLKNKTTGAYDNFIKPSMNVNGSTYDNIGNLDSNYKMYANSQQQPTSVAQPTPSAQPNSNPYMDQYTQMIKDIQTRLAAPQQDVYSTPQYAAAQAQQQRAAQQGIRSAQESLGGAGFGRSTALGEAANRAQNTANEYLQMQLVPQIQQQLAAQRQADISNQFSLLNPVMSLLNRDDTLKQNDFSNGIAKAGVTGYYQPGQTDIEAINKLMGQNSAAYGAASPEEQQRLHADNVRLAASIGGTDTTGNGDYSYSPMRTLQGQQMDTQNQQWDKQFNAQEAQRQWDNTFKQGQFDYQKASDLWEQNFKDKSFDQSVKQFAANLGADYAKLNQSQQQFVAEMAYKNKALEMQNDPNNLDNQYKKAQIESMTNKNEKSANHGIDEYDLAMIDSLASQKGLDLGKADSSSIKQFVAGLKTQNAWTTEEAKQVEDYLGQKATAAQAVSNTANAQRADRIKKADDIAKRLGSGRIGG